MQASEFDFDLFTKTVIEANKELYWYINTNMSSLDLQESKTIGYGGDKSLNIDIIAEKIFIKHLAGFGDIFSEEIGLVSSNSNIKIIIDPLDGSDNFLSQLPYYGTSIALQINSVTKAGYVTNLSNATIIYKVEEKDNQSIKHISLLTKKTIKSYEIKESKLGIFERAYAYPEISKKLNENGLKFRSCGAAALSLAYANSVNFVLFAGKTREFDIAASIYINNKLFIHQDDEFLIVTKNHSFLEQIKDIIKNNKI